MPQDVLGHSVAQAAHDSLRELGEINARLVQRLSEQQLEVLRTTMEASARETQLLSQPASYQSLPSQQAALVREYNEKFLEIARRTADILRETRDELTAWVQRGLDQATSTAGAASTTAGAAAPSGGEAPSAGRKRTS